MEKPVNSSTPKLLHSLPLMEPMHRALCALYESDPRIQGHNEAAVLYATQCGGVSHSNGYTEQMPFLLHCLPNQTFWSRYRSPHKIPQFNPDVQVLPSPVLIYRILHMCLKDVEAVQWGGLCQSWSHARQGRTDLAESLVLRGQQQRQPDACWKGLPLQSH